jgi:hypothetical protein
VQDLETANKTRHVEGIGVKGLPWLLQAKKPDGLANNSGQLPPANK